MSEVILAYVVRHGTTIMNQQNIFRGDANPPLDKKGWRDANMLANYFEPIECYQTIFCSDKLRAHSTGRAIAQRKASVDVQLVPDLRPWNIGDFGGLEKNDENKAKLQYFVQNPDIPTPNGEALNEARARTVPIFQEAIEIADQTGLPVILTVHSSVIHIVGETFGGHHEAAHVKPGGVAAIYWDGHRINAKPIFKLDERSTTQNVLGSQPRSGLMS